MDTVLIKKRPRATRFMTDNNENGFTKRKVGKYVCIHRNEMEGWMELEGKSGRERWSFL